MLMSPFTRETTHNEADQHPVQPGASPARNRFRSRRSFFARSANGARNGPVSSGHSANNGPATGQASPRTQAHSAPGPSAELMSGPSSSSSSIFSNSESSWPAESSEYAEFIAPNTLDIESGRRLQALQTSISNPDLSPSVRAILQTAYRQFEKQSARSREHLPAYSNDEMPPSYVSREDR